VFCRNLLIYLDAPARASVLATIDRLLTPEGVLFIGHADRLDLAGTQPHFTPVGEAGCFAYVRTVSEIGLSRSPPPPQLSPPQPLTSLIAPCTVAITQRPASGALDSDSGATEKGAASGDSCARVPAAQPPSLLEQAAELANQGQHAEAIAACQRHLQLKGPGASAYYLMGMISQAAGDRQRAEDCFHKTLYLDPKHDEALLALALMADRRGDHTAAATYRRRARRTMTSNAIRNVTGQPGDDSR
jgi:chemotaxis protein methyltransferase WspC